MLKYLLLIFIFISLALAADIRWGHEIPNPYTDGRLLSMPMPPVVRLSEAPMLPPPVLHRVESPPLNHSYVGAKLEIYDPQAGTGRLEQTLEAGRADWGIRNQASVSDLAVATVNSARVVQVIPVNTPTPQLPDPFPLFEDSTVLAELMADIDEWQTRAGNFDVLSTASVGAEPISPELIETTDLAAEPMQVASNSPPINLRAHSVLQPNLYLPEGATDEEGAALTLILPNLYVYKLPDVAAEKSPWTLRSGDRVRPQTRLRNQDDFDWIKISVDGETWWAQAEYFIRVDPRNKMDAGGVNLAIGTEKVDRESALPVNYKPNDLSGVSEKYTFGRRDIELRSEAVRAFEEMAFEASRKNLNIRIFSGFRDFDHQKKLYIDAIERQGPKQNGTAAPGYSEHQLGTTADISGNDRRTVLSGRFGETPEGRWLHENSERFGFRKSYTSENTEEVGYKPEPWHFRYVGRPATSAERAATASAP